MFRAELCFTIIIPTNVSNIFYQSWQTRQLMYRVMHSSTKYKQPDGRAEAPDLLFGSDSRLEQTRCDEWHKLLVEWELVKVYDESLTTPEATPELTYYHCQNLPRFWQR